LQGDAARRHARDSAHLPGVRLILKVLTRSVAIDYRPWRREWEAETSGRNTVTERPERANGETGPFAE